MANHPAVIYCRVSSAKQVREGHGLASQETRCREFAQLKGYQVVEVFHDEGVSGSLINRPGMHALLTYLQKTKAREPIVLIDDVSRLARGLDAHLQLRVAISKAGGKLESPSIEFGEDSDSQLIENLLASVSQHQRQKNAEQVVHRMRARAMNGYWVTSRIWGYRYEKVPGHGKLLVRDEPMASVIKEALEGFASGRLQSQMDVKLFLEKSAVFPCGKNGLHLQRVKDVLQRVFYAGYITLPNWGIHLVPGKHEPLITYETFKRIQERLQGKAKAPPRTEYHQDFPLRGYVACAGCGHLLTACWTKGRNALYPYYLCQSRDCTERNKSIKQADLEGEFEVLLKKLSPSKQTFKMLVTMAEDWWQQYTERQKQNAKDVTTKLKTLDADIDQLLARVLKATSDKLIATYEKKIETLEEEKVRLREMSLINRITSRDFAESYQTALSFLSNPYKLWVSNEYEHKKLVTKLVFAAPPQYQRKVGYRTALTAYPFRILSALERGNYELVGLDGETSNQVFEVLATWNTYLEKDVKWVPGVEP